MAELTIFRAIAPGGVETLQAQNGRTYWKITDDTGQQWTCWDPNTAVQANVFPPGQLTQMKVRIAPARDPQYGVNYSLIAIAPAPPGSSPTPAGMEQQQPALPMQPMQMGGAAIQPTQMNVPTAITPGYPTQQPVPMTQPQGPLPSPPIKTLGQGGNFSDADITRMARSTAVEAATGLAQAFAPDFSDPEGNFDWMRFWLAAEAIAKHIVQRAHEGWVPGVEMDAPRRPESLSNEQQVLAEVQALPGTVEVPVAPQGVPAQASAEHADGGEIDWSNP